MRLSGREIAITYGPLRGQRICLMISFGKCVIEAEREPSNAIVLLSGILSTLCNNVCTPSTTAKLFQYLLVVLGVDDGVLPLASGHVAVEQDVDLAVRAALHLRDEEVGQDQAEQCRTRPNVTAFSAEVCALCGFSCERLLCTEAYGEQRELTSELSM